METREVSKAVISRMPRYYRYLGDLIQNGVERISSNELSEIMHVTSSQIRQDLNNFGGFGQQGYGYNVKKLRREIAKILDLNTKHSMVVIGVGNLGRALTNYSSFESKGFIVKGLFDIRPEFQGKVVRKIPIRMLDELEDFLDEEDIQIAVLTLSNQKVQEVVDILVRKGVKAIWNFVHTDLELPGDIIVENVHLSDSLMTLSYNLAQVKHKKHSKQ